MPDPRAVLSYRGSWRSVCDLCWGDVTLCVYEFSSVTSSTQEDDREAAEQLLGGERTSGSSLYVPDTELGYSLFQPLDLRFTG
jgi:hypothetical protein